MADYTPEPDNPLLRPLDLDVLSTALDNTEADPEADPDDDPGGIAPGIILDAARNWMEHCTLTQLRRVVENG